jgi:hypothetical protein
MLKGEFGPVQSQVLGITISRHQDLEKLLKGFNQPYNMRRPRAQRCRTRADRARALGRRAQTGDPPFKPPDSEALPQALHVVAAAKDVSHPDTLATAALLGTNDPKWRSQFAAHSNLVQPADM